MAREKKNIAFGIVSDHGNEIRLPIMDGSGRKVFNLRKVLLFEAYMDTKYERGD